MGLIKYPYTWLKSNGVQFARSLDTKPFINCINTAGIDFDVSLNAAVKFLDNGTEKLRWYEDGNGSTLMAANNTDLFLKTQGTGLVKFGTHAALGGEALSGYITITDAAGTDRKIGVIS